MELGKNVGIIDRIFRAILGTLLVLGGIIYMSSLALFVWVFVGTVLIITAFTAACPVYSALDICTCDDPACDMGRKKATRKSAAYKGKASSHVKKAKAKKAKKKSKKTKKK